MFYLMSEWLVSSCQVNIKFFIHDLNLDTNKVHNKPRSLRSVSQLLPPFLDVDLLNIRTFISCDL